MKFRNGTRDDLKDITKLERLALPFLDPYIEKGQNFYFEETEGEILLVEKDDQLVGMGRYTIMPDGTMWIETIRVDPDHQGQGIGTAIYEEMERIAQDMDIDTVRMYTEIFNDKSIGLVTKRGFTHIGTYGCLELKPMKNPEYIDPFNTVQSSETGYELLEKYRNDWGDFISLNRAFFSISPETTEYLTDNGYIYSNGDDAYILGSRLLHNEHKFLGFLGGNIKNCVESAINKTPSLTDMNLFAIYPKERTDIEKILLDYGFEDTYDLIVYEKEL